MPIANSPSGRAFTARRTFVFGDDELRTQFLDAAARSVNVSIYALDATSGDLTSAGTTGLPTPPSAIALRAPS